MRIATTQKVNEILAKNNLHAVKKFGQNFIIEPTVVEQITNLGEVDKDTFVIEIGPGIGSLTQVLLEQAGFVHAVELDKKLPPVLNQLFSECDNFLVTQGDILQTDINKMIKDNSKYLKFKIFGNLPYYITTPILFHIFETVDNVDEVVVMMQKEVAERICSKPGDRNFNNLSVACQVYSTPSIILDVPPNSFNPKPAVDSSVVKFKITNNSEIGDKKAFIEFIKKCFKQPRKTLYNNLRGILEQETIEKHVSSSARPNTIDIETYIKLFKEAK